MKIHHLTFILLFLLGLIGCQGSDSTSSDPYSSDQVNPTQNDWIVVHQLHDPDQLLPTHYASVASEIICTQLLFQPLQYFHPQTLELVPVLAATKPIVSPDGLKFTFQIRKEAKWDNGKLITGQDFLTTLKITRVPQVGSRLALYLSFIEEVFVNPKNPQEFTIICKEKGINNLSWISTILILPAYIYDSKGILEGFSLTELSNTKEAEKSQALSDFAKEFLSEKFKREPGSVIGSGPYHLAEWVTGEKVVLDRKKDWWADSLQDSMLQAWPKKLIFKTINDLNTAILELKAGNIDLIYGVKPNIFKELTQNQELKKQFELKESDMFVMSFIGMNMKPGRKRKPFFTDIKVRQAMAHLLDMDKAINQFIFGYARRINGPIPALKSAEYNPGIPLVKFDIAQARKLLAEAGWEDTNGNGILDKMIQGKREELEVELAYGNGVEVRKNIGLMYAEDARKAGVKIKVTGYEPSVLEEKRISRDLDMLYSIIASSPEPTDLKDLFHTESWVSGGFNYMGFSTSKTDSLIEAARVEMDPMRRKGMMDSLQSLIVAETPCIWMMSSKNLIAVHKRIKGFVPTVVRPNFYVQQFWVPENLTRYGKSEKKD